MSVTVSSLSGAASTRRSETVWAPSARLSVSRPVNDDLLAAATAGPDDRVLVLGGERADLLCAALRRGCRSAIGLVAAQRHPEPADVVVAPRVTTREEAFAVADCARRALRGGARRGRLAIGLVGAGAASLARALERGLQSYGFTRARLRARAEGGVLFVCEMPAPAPAPNGSAGRGAEQMPNDLVLSALRGSIPALPTPFVPGDPASLDRTALARLVERAVRGGSSAVVVAGSTGEGPALHAEEQAEAVRIAAAALRGRHPVIAGVGAPNTEAAAALAANAERCGASALLVSAPPYVRPTQEGLRAHVRAVAAASGLPVVLYDVPSRAGIAFADDTIARLRDDGVVQALKDATADLSRPVRLRRRCGEEFLQLSGDDATALAHRAMGGIGCISVTANVVPALCAALHAAWDGQDWAAAARLRDLLAPLHDALFAESNPIPVKGALGLLKLCDPTPRLPLMRASRDTLHRLAEILPQLAAADEWLAAGNRRAA